MDLSNEHEMCHRSEDWFTLRKKCYACYKLYKKYGSGEVISERTENALARSDFSTNRNPIEV